MSNIPIIETPSVCVLLSLFNGERYLEDQVMSLAFQRDVDVFIYARDDGSTDNTPNLFRSLCLRYGVRYELVENETRLGPAKSFFELLVRAPDGYDFYALCDQDDYWLPDKLKRAIDHLSGQSASPVLYASALAVTDAGLTIKRLTSVPKKATLGMALIENHVTGCTAVLNRAGRESLIVALPGQCIMHDWWMYIHFCAVGRVVLDQNASILYRQHGTNCVGMTQARKSWRYRWTRHFSRQDTHPQIIQAKEFLLRSGDRLNLKERRLIEGYVDSLKSVWKRLLLAFDLRFRRVRLLDTLIWRLLVLSNRH